MARLLRVLNIEDSLDDSFLLRRFLTKEGYDLHFRQVQTREEFHTALDASEWDIILADFNVPGFNAPDALRVLQETGDDIPLVVVSGAVGEDAAAEIMRAGAADFVLKDRLSRLSPVIEREMNDAVVRRERRAEQFARVQTEAKLRAILDHSPAAIFMKDMDGRYTLVNNTFAERVGASEQEILGKTDADLFSEEIANRMHTSDLIVLSGAEPHPELHSLPGESQEFITVKFPIFDAFGAVQGIGGISTPAHYVPKERVNLKSQKAS